MDKERNDNMEYRVNLDGKSNSKYIDLLDVDKSVAGQKFVCLSFVSPEKVLKQKDTFYFEHFLKNWDFKKSVEKYTQFLNFISYKYNLNMDNLTKDLHNFIEEEKDKLTEVFTIDDEYKNFLDQNEESLEKQFNELNGFQTSTRGIKVRGSFPSQQEAELRCKMLRELDPNHDVYVGSVGIWMPFHPEAYKTGRVEYLEEELNQLMYEKKKNEDKAKDEFEKRVKETKMKAMEENKKKALESGNVLTQTINEEGNLVSLTNMNTQEQSLGADGEVSTADIRKELFEGENVVMTKDGDHGLSQLEGVTFSLESSAENKKLNPVKEDSKQNPGSDDN
jgi:hypothetical protein